jgi:ribosome-associated translation inhibitor RaiA
MRITITARHCEVPQELRDRARVLLERLRKVASRPHDGQAIFSDDHGTPTVELRLHTGRGTVHVGSAGAAHHRTALDRAAAKVRRQLDKATPARRRAAERRHAVEHERA